MFSYFKDKSEGATIYYIDKEEVVEKKRIKKLIYQKD